MEIVVLCNDHRELNRLMSNYIYIEDVNLISNLDTYKKNNIIKHKNGNIVRFICDAINNPNKIRGLNPKIIFNSNHLERDVCSYYKSKGIFCLDYWHYRDNSDMIELLHEMMNNEIWSGLCQIK